MLVPDFMPKPVGSLLSGTVERTLVPGLPNPLLSQNLNKMQQSRLDSKQSQAGVVYF